MLRLDSSLLAILAQATQWYHSGQSKPYGTPWLLRASCSTQPFIMTRSVEDRGQLRHGITEDAVCDKSMNSLLSLMAIQ